NYNRLFIPRPKTKAGNGLKTLNSKAVGRLLAAGGIYNGNIEGFRETADKLGGDAPAGYDQFMDNKGLLIAGASIVAGAVLGRLRLPDLESLEHFGARGAVSGRPFNPELAGGPIENLTTDGVTINREGIAIVEKHIARFGHDPVNEVMINRLKDIEKGKIPPEQVDLNFYTHECREYQRYCNLGWETGLNRPGFPGECFICELRLPDHRFRWKHNKLFLLLPEEYGPAFPAIVDCYTSPPT
ncbi:hypothetical protein, partial [Escherichia coli]